jgi:enoyl-[acyl-carrier protein] reductase I
MVNTQYALILGGTTGLGFASVKKLAAEGFNIIIVHRTRKTDLVPFQEFVNSTNVNVIEFATDALNKEKRDDCIQHLEETLPNHSIKVMLHSIAKGNLNPLVNSDKTLSSNDYQLTINAMGTSLLDWSQALLNANLFSKHAKILAFTSEGNTKVIPNYGAVSAAKVVLESIIKQMAVEFAPYNITSNAIQAGVTDTSSLRMIPGSEKLINLALQRNPYKRLTTPEDVANAVYLLSRDEANWMTGNIIKVDGGEHLR